MDFFENGPLSDEEFQKRLAEASQPIDFLGSRQGMKIDFANGAQIEVWDWINGRWELVERNTYSSQ